jgi:hypothetical protein
LKLSDSGLDHRSLIALIEKGLADCLRRKGLSAKMTDRRAQRRAASRPPKRPDNDTITRLAQIGRVKSELIPRLGLNVGLAVEIAWQSTNRRKLLVDRRARASLVQIRNAARNLHAAVKMRHQGIDTLLDIYLQGAARDGEGLDIRMTDIAAAVESLLTATEITLEVMSPSASIDPDRRARSGPANYPQFLFVSQLLRSFAECGAVLTLDKNLGTGTLVEVLRALAPDLPRELGLSASKLPISTLARIKATGPKPGKTRAKIGRF